MYMDHRRPKIKGETGWTKLTWEMAVKVVRVGVQNKKLSYRRETARQLPTWRG